LKCGPPFKAVNSCPSSSKATVITEPSGRPAACSASLVYRVVDNTLEFLKMEV